MTTSVPHRTELLFNKVNIRPIKTKASPCWGRGLLNSRRVGWCAWRDSHPSPTQGVGVGSRGGFGPPNRRVRNPMLCPLSYRLAEGKVKAAGIEPATDGLKARCSASELRVHERGAGGGHRTRTSLARLRILSPVRLPVPPPRHTSF